MVAALQLRGRQRLRTTTAPTPVGGLNAVAPFAAMPATDAIALTNLIPAAGGATTRLGSQLRNYHIGSTQASSVFTPPTSATATCVIDGISFTATFNTNATQTITDLKALVTANTTVMGLVSLSGTTTLIVTALAPGALGNGITTTSNNANGASWTFTATSGGATVDSEVRSVIPFQGSNSAENRLYVATKAGIWDISLPQNAATLVQAFGTTTGQAGYCQFTNFTTVAGNYLAVCDEANGYFLYEQSSHTWNQATVGAGPWQVTGVDPTTLTSVVSWQNRLFFTQRSSGTGWYLGTGLIVGAATAFPFGNNMKRGGELRCYANWTVDGGAGVENNLAVISGAGDISVYTGTDPSTVGQFTLVGTWNFSGLPSGRRLTIDSGGDVLVLTSYGAISLSKLLQGASLADRSIYETAKIAPAITTEVITHGASLDWALALSPDEVSILISAPQQDLTYVQYAFNLQTKGWARLEGRNSKCLGVYQSHLFFGDDSGSVWQVEGGQDHVAFDGTGGAAINFFYFSAFQGLDDSNLNKRPQLVRPAFLTQATDLNWITACRYDYDLSTLTGTPVSSPFTGALWDLATWDNAVWGGSAVPSEKLNGVQGMGRMVALLVRGVAKTTTTLNNIDIMYELGGLL